MPLLPQFLVKKVPKHRNIQAIRNLIGDTAIHTVCEEAKCPNVGECFSNKTCTFMILGDTCTRSCSFCGVKHGIPQPIDKSEPQKVATAAKKLNLNYVVITSVTRDDLIDGGAAHFANVIYALKIFLPNAKVEVLIPDFKGERSSLKIVLSANPFVLNHNIETVPRLYKKVRPQAEYLRSLALLREAKELNASVYTKSGFMVGLGEEKDEIFEVLSDLKNTGCDFVTIGQYLAPTKSNLPPERYVSPEEYESYIEFGQKIGLKKVIAGPFVRSSYHAEKIF